MPTEAEKPRVTPAQVIEDMARLTARELEKVIERAAVLRLQKRKLVLPTRESDLLGTINRGLSAEKGAGLEQLQKKLRQETISRREQEQLIRLSEQLEQLATERLQSLIEIAAIRKTSVAKLMNQMGLARSGFA
jgi:hypothetical protein